MTLPVHDALVTVAVTGKVFLSLRTKDPALARTRFTQAQAALVRYWDSVRAGPRPLTHKQLVALAGDVYRQRVEAIEADPAHGPHVIALERRMMQEAFAEWKYGAGDGLGEIDDDEASLLAALQRPYGPQLLALETGRDVDTPYAKVTYAEALEDLFGADADRLCATRALVIDRDNPP